MRKHSNADGPHEIHIPTGDGHVLKGHWWRHAESTDRTMDVPVVVINPATSVAARYYYRFAAYLQHHGMDVLTYDYRGIGLSRPEELRGFEAGWLIWGERDFEAVLQWLSANRPGRSVDVVAHSVGGFVTGLAASAHRVRRVCMVAAQLGYWRDFHPAHRTRMWWKWQFVMPLLATLMGYFPGQRLGWLEDTPKGVVCDWTQKMRRLEDAWGCSGPERRLAERKQLVERCANMRAPILSIGIEDDAFGTRSALERLLGYFPFTERVHVRVAPEAVGASRIGHFAFFHDRFEHSLWPLALGWLQSGELTAAMQQAAPHHVVPALRCPSLDAY